SYIAALDISIVHLRADPLFKTVIPSKIFESMAMGVPLLMAVEGESAAIVRDAAAGLCIPSGDPRAMADGALALADRPDERRRMGDAGREAVRARYGRKPLADAALRTLDRAASAREGDAS